MGLLSKLREQYEERLRSMEQRKKDTEPAKELAPVVQRPIHHGPILDARKTIKAIETHYQGYRFRSRTEARWAVFFDSLGLKWEYEKEGFELPSGWYLPDFWIFDNAGLAGWWFEIKGQKPTSSEIRLCEELSKATGYYVHLPVGVPSIEHHGNHLAFHDREGWTTNNRFWFTDDRVKNAINQARSARFEFSERNR